MVQADGRSLMTAIGGELSEVRALVDDLSLLASDLIARCPPPFCAEAIARAQAFDLVIQRLDVLGGFMADIGSGTAPETALQGVTLSDVADRLTGRGAGPVVPSGDLVLFD